MCWLQRHRDNAIGDRQPKSPIAQSYVRNCIARGRWQLAAKLVCNVGEGRVCTASDRADRTQANYNDQSQHHRVFNSGWAVFRLQETINLRGEILHGISPMDVHPAVRRGAGNEKLHAYYHSQSHRHSNQQFCTQRAKRRRWSIRHTSRPRIGLALET